MAINHPTASQRNDRHTYRLRLMGTLAGTLLLLNVIVQWWPSSGQGGTFYTLYATHSEPMITMEEVLPTLQVREQKPPPVPLPPVVIPQEVLLHEIDLVLPDSFVVVEDAGLDPDVREGKTDSFARAAIHGNTPGARRFPRCSCERH